MEERRAGWARRTGRAGIVRAMGGRWGAGGSCATPGISAVRVDGGKVVLRRRKNEEKTRRSQDQGDGGKPGAGGVLDTQCEAVTKKVPALRSVCRSPCGGR